MNIVRTKHYTHLIQLEEDGTYQHSPILIVGSSGKGKSIFKERSIENIEDVYPQVITIELVDVLDTLEGAFPMFPATFESHVAQLAIQKEEPEARKVKLWVVYGHDLKEWQRIEKKLPEAEVITFGAKSILQRDEIMFLLGKQKEDQTVRLMMRLGEELKNNEDLRFARHHCNKMVLRKKEFYAGKQMEIGEEEPVADRGSVGDVEGALHIFESDKCIQPEDFRLNFDVHKIFNESGTRHVIVYRCLKKDEKLRSFVFFHIFNEIVRHINECKYPINLVIEEAQSIAPFRGEEAYESILSSKVGKSIGELRKAGGGVSIFMLGRVWNKISENVRAECAKQVLFHIEMDDMHDVVKVSSLGKKARLNIENMGVGEFVLRGNETKLFQCKVPRHGHKHPGQHFMVEYRKHFPEKLRTYNDVIDEVESIDKKLAQEINAIVKVEIEKRKDVFRKQQMHRARSEKEREQFRSIESELKQKKVSEKEMRNQEIIKVFNELQGKKWSYRIIAGILKGRNIKVSHQTVKNVLENSATPERVEEKTVQNE